MIRLVGVTKQYMIGGKPFFALKNICLYINDGEMIAICGKSGAGKSSLLHILGCLETFEKGTYSLDGINVGSCSAADLARIRSQKIGFVMQDFSLINHKTALYNVEAAMFFNQTPFREMKKKALEALEKAGVWDQADKKVVNMSGGQRQRVAIARAIVNDPSVILADEPTGNLDSKTTDDIMALFQTLHKQGKTILIVTHDAHVASFCDRVIELSDGKIV